MKTYTEIINKLMLGNEFSGNLDDAQQIIDSLQIQPTYPIILVGGTNGKGSTCAYLTNILTAAGYKVGTFTSPHVFEYNERITINNTPITDNNLEFYLKQVANLSDNNLGIFKTFTLAAHLYFIAKEIDIAVIEVGIGGKSDVTNLFEPTISAITGVDFDHCHILGNNLDTIGLEKAHIYRPHKWAFYGSYSPPQCIIEYAHKINAKLEILGTDFDVMFKELSFDVKCNNRAFYSLPYPALRGKEQVYNVALTLAVLNKLQDNFPVSLGTIKTSLLQTKLVGRFQVMPGQPQIIFDVAHNPQAVKNMIQNMVKLPFAKKNIAVFGILNDKDIAKVIDLAHKSFDNWYIASLNSTRNVSNEELKKILLQHAVEPNQIFEYQNIKLAMQNALNAVADSDRIVCFGSFLTVEEAYKEYNTNLNKRQSESNAI